MAPAINSANAERQQRGQRAEQLAAQWLCERGLTLVERNYLGPGGEIDLVMRDQRGWVFVEVRYRQSMAFGGAASSLSNAKLRRVRATALHYLQCRGCAADEQRIDALLLDGPSLDDPALQVEWIKSIIDDRF